MPNGERIILVETRVDYEAPFNVGLTVAQFDNFRIARPRYAGRCGSIPTGRTDLLIRTPQAIRCRTARCSVVALRQFRVAHGLSTFASGPIKIGGDAYARRVHGMCTGCATRASR
jgi:hypothetical protein